MYFFQSLAAAKKVTELFLKAATVCGKQPSALRAAQHIVSCITKVEINNAGLQKRSRRTARMSSHLIPIIITFSSLRGPKLNFSRRRDRRRNRAAHSRAASTHTHIRPHETAVILTASVIFHFLRQNLEGTYAADFLDWFSTKAASHMAWRWRRAGKTIPFHKREIDERKRKMHPAMCIAPLLWMHPAPRVCIHLPGPLRAQVYFYNTNTEASPPALGLWILDTVRWIGVNKGHGRIEWRTDRCSVHKF